MANVSIDGNLIVAGTQTITGATTFAGSLALGDAATDTIGFYGTTPAVQPAATAQSAVATTTITTTATTTITSIASTSLTALDVTRINAAFSRIEEIRVVSDALATRVEAIRVLQNQTRSDLVTVGIQKGSA